jgi:hypothetical protein
MTEWMRWVRDWALFGGITSAVAPSLASARGLAPSDFWVAAAAIGATSGAAVGLLAWGATHLFPERSRVAVSAVLLPPALGGWGAAVSAAAASQAAPGFEELATICGSVAALLQTAWFAPAYALQARRGGWRWPLLCVAPVTAALAGVAAVVTALMVLDF